MVVASTPTASDALLERKAILAEKAKDIAALDVVKQELEMLRPVLTAIKEEIKASGALPDPPERARCRAGDGEEACAAHAEPRPGRAPINPDPDGLW